MKHDSRRTDSLHNSRQRRKAESIFMVPSKQGFFFFAPLTEKPPQLSSYSCRAVTPARSLEGGICRLHLFLPLRLRSALARPRCVGECKYAAVVSSHWPVTPLCGRVGEGARRLYKSTVPSSVSVTQRGLTEKLPADSLKRKGRWSLSPLA